MRLIVACSRCQRQYDATARGVGGRFRCHCGEMLTVDSPQGHDAEVVRCSSCGGPREKGTKACGYCGADFTIHEQDLNTVCPGCLAIVSDRARYCHHCGLSIQPEATAGDESKLSCPECERQHFLVSRSLGIEKVSALECPCCAGLWLSDVVFERLIERSLNNSLPDGHHVGEPRSTLPKMQNDAEWRYRPCPACRQLMQRQNYGRASGVIVDICRHHGIWFDANELPRILDWVRLGGLKQARDREAQKKRKEQRQPTRMPLEDSPDTLSDGEWAAADLFLESIGGAFRRLFGP